jgi:hypothetical protein
MSQGTPLMRMVEAKTHIDCRTAVIDTWGKTGDWNAVSKVLGVAYPTLHTWRASVFHITEDELNTARDGYLQSLM